MWHFKRWIKWLWLELICITSFHSLCRYKHVLLFPKYPQVCVYTFTDLTCLMLNIKIAELWGNKIDATESEIILGPTYINALLCDVLGEKRDSRQTDSRETEMKSAGGEPCLYMHGWWKNVSLNGSQLSAALRTAKTSQGNKIWHYYYYYTAIINYPFSPAFAVSLSFLHRRTRSNTSNRLTQTHTHVLTPLIFSWSQLSCIWGETNTQRHMHEPK